jgi:hypothetical protein
MTDGTTSTTTIAQNPLDMVEEIVIANDWPFERLSNDEMVVECRGRWSTYRLFFFWQDDVNAIQFSCQVGMRASPDRTAAVHELLALINERMWLGHFDIERTERAPTFRHTSLLRGNAGADAEMLEDILDIALTECERFYPAFHFVCTENREPADAVAAAIIDTIAEA